ncbi:unnamed protein product [Effrenium voratum]|nr:unnamed protein product [Effrenium voratum]
MASGLQTQQAFRKVELLGWLMHLRYLSDICSNPLLQSMLLSNLSSRVRPDKVTIRSLARDVCMEVKMNLPPLPRLLSALRAAHLGQGEPLDLALCFVALGRALKIRTRLVRCLQVARTSGVELGKRSRGIWEQLTAGGVGEENALFAALEMEATEGVDSTILAYAGLRSEPRDQVLCTWAECFEESSNTWIAVDPVGPVVAVAPLGLWLHPQTPWICAGDDALQADYCELADVTDRYHRPEDIRKTRAPHWEQLAPWWTRAVQQLSGHLASLQKTPEAVQDVPVPMCQDVAVPTGQARLNRAQVKKVQKRQGATSLPSLEPFKERAMQLQEHLQSHGVLPWHKGATPQERRLGRWVQSVKHLRKAGRLKPEDQQRLSTWCPLWAEVEAPRKPEVAEVAEPSAPCAGSQMAWVKASLALARCRSSEQRRQTLRRLQLDFHPDKNMDRPEVRPMFDFIQDMWEKEFRRGEATSAVECSGKSRGDGPPSCAASDAEMCCPDGFRAAAELHNRCAQPECAGVAVWPWGAAEKSECHAGNGFWMWEPTCCGKELGLRELQCVEEPRCEAAPKEAGLLVAVTIPVVIAGVLLLLRCCCRQRAPAFGTDVRSLEAGTEMSVADRVEAWNKRSSDQALGAPPAHWGGGAAPLLRPKPKPQEPPEDTLAPLPSKARKSSSRVTFRTQDSVMEFSESQAASSQGVPKPGPKPGPKPVSVPVQAQHRPLPEPKPKPETKAAPPKAPVPAPSPPPVKVPEPVKEPAQAQAGWTGNEKEVSASRLLFQHRHRRSADPEYTVNTFGAIWFSVGMNTLTLLVAICLLSLALRSVRFRRQLAPRLPQEQADALPFPFGWMQLAASHRSLRDEIGLDALVVVRFLDLGFKFSLFGSLLCIVLLPMYSWTQREETLNKFTRFSLSNIDGHHPGDHIKFQIVVVCAYFLNAAFVHLMISEWQSFMNLRRKQFRQTVLGSHGPGAAQAIRSILVENVPRELRSAEILHRYFARLFGEGALHSTVVQSDTRALHRIEGCCRCCCWKASERLSEMRERIRPDVARGIQLQEMSQSGRNRRTTVVEESSLLAGLDLPVVAREFSRKFQTYTITLASTVSKALPATELVRSSRSCSSTAFVTFNTVQMRVMAEQVLLSHRSDWRLRSAPESRDIVWSNASTPWKLTYPRSIVSQCLCFVGVLFWSVPVSTIQLWSNVESLEKLFPRLFHISLSPCKLCSTFVVKYLPVVTLILLLSLLPYVFEAMTKKYERYKVKSDIHRIVLTRYFGYLLCTLYVAVVAGSVWDTLETILREPPRALQEVREAVPSVAVYFITFVLARVGITIPILLFYPCLFQETSCYFATEASDAALILVLGLTYSAIAPLILPACAVYFCLASVVYRWLFLYTYEPEFDCAGSFWYDLFDCSICGLFFSNIMLLALAGGHTQLNSYSFYATAILPITTVVFKAFCERRFGRPSRFVALEDAVEADLAAQEAAQSHLDLHYYVDPVLSSRSNSSSSSLGRRNAR